MNINELADKNGARVFEFFDRPIDWWFIKRLRKKIGDVTKLLCAGFGRYAGVRGGLGKREK